MKIRLVDENWPLVLIPGAKAIGLALTLQRLAKKSEDVELIHYLTERANDLAECYVEHQPGDEWKRSVFETRRHWQWNWTIKDSSSAFVDRSTLPYANAS